MRALLSLLPVPYTVLIKDDGEYHVDLHQLGGCRFEIRFVIDPLELDKKLSVNSGITGMEGLF